MAIAALDLGIITKDSAINTEKTRSQNIPNGESLVEETMNLEGKTLEELFKLVS